MKNHGNIKVPFSKKMVLEKHDKIINVNKYISLLMKFLSNSVSQISNKHFFKGRLKLDRFSTNWKLRAYNDRRNVKKQTFFYVICLTHNGSLKKTVTLVKSFY